MTYASIDIYAECVKLRYASYAKWLHDASQNKLASVAMLSSSSSSISCCAFMLFDFQVKSQTGNCQAYDFHDK